ncbi:MAG TPA: hypothetical protein VIY73_10565, partial [Polyangiaceae bacterium]
VTGGKAPDCTTGTISVACTAQTSCKTQLGGLTCTGTQIVHLCKQASDCTEANYKECCTFTQDGGSISFCANALVGGAAGATCQ